MKKFLLGATGVVASGIGYAYYSTKKLGVTSYEIYSEKIPRGFDGERYVQLSDLHSAVFGESNYKLIEAVENINPAGIFITGDLIHGDEPHHVALALVRKLLRTAPIYYVSGNHEWGSAFYPELFQSLEAAGVTILRNETIFLEKDQARIALAGVEDPAFMLPRPASITFRYSREELEPVLSEAINQAADGIPADVFTILLAHRPEFWPLYQEKRPDLVLSGHAHGGQVRLPFTEGLFSPGQGLMPKLTAGLHQAGSKKMIISRGLGNSSILVPRVLNNPEIVEVTLRADGLQE
ncbi:putative metallophosphoesterase ykuE [Listeria floridensis FSL S10-1187]|uniref:Metallophosphoesterase ykuE n=1 Tax=Listeria floridensis FSL S10-1187 TaxID=1265817 RepID=A0ABN0RDZ2_9LIST|nr:metallophosphoesterase [Listeria floridensis]EUJ30318.1 putative metallophosphoesterase ykuE [Listeria floridensis FSL S10-1187]